MDEELLIGLLRVFVPLSFLSIGGGGTILAEMAHQTVDVYHWPSPAPRPAPASSSSR
jgi:chromate transporter